MRRMRTSQMMEQQSASSNGNYNEVVLNIDDYKRNLPHSIEAVFYITQQQKYIAKQAQAR